MSQPPPAPPSLQDPAQGRSTPSTRKSHGLLMARGDIIDRLIPGEADPGGRPRRFRPAREADMIAPAGGASSRHPAARTRWRASGASSSRPSRMCRRRFRVHADISLGESAMRDSARFHFGFTVPYVLAFQRAPPAVDAVARSKGDLALVSGHFQPHPVVDRAGGRWRNRRSSRGCRSSSAPTIPRHFRYFVISRVGRQRHGHRSRDCWGGVRVSGWNAEIAARRAGRHWAEIVAVPDTAFDGGGPLLVSVASFKQR